LDEREGAAGAPARRAAGDADRVAGDVAPGGLSFSPSRPAFWIAAAAVGGFTALMNSLSRVSDLDRWQVTFRRWEPFTWEVTSVLATLALLPALAAFVERRPWSRRPRRVTAALYGGAAVAWSALHVGGMVALRLLVYAAAGVQYRFGSVPSEFLYELRKDLVSFGILVTILNLLREVERRLVAPVLAAGPPPEGRIAIRDGAREVDLDCRTIVAVRAAGNYVEVFRAGEKPLMLRATLGEAEARLAASGFARVHRSWLVGVGHVEAVTASGSGDFRARLTDGSEAPVSRRYKDALPQLRTSS
jgi:hypothetical protein